MRQLGFVWFLFAALNVVVIAAVLYVATSAAVSGLKLAMGSCGTTYRVKVVGQDWFCPEVER